MNNKEGRLHFSITANNEDIRRKLAETRQGIINSGKAAEEQGSKIEGMFKRAALAAGAFFTVQQATSFAKQIAVVRGEFQQLEVAFTTMLGSASKGKLMMQEAVEIAAKTPFDLKGVAQGAKQLLAYGSASQDVGKELVMLGNIAAGLSIPLNDMVYLYGTTQTQGRLFTQDLRQFMGRGIPLADELAKQFGVAKEQVGELVTAGKVGFPEVQKALQAMTADGGKFNNLMAEQSKTITGQIFNLGDSIDVMFNKLGQANEGAISYAISGAASLIENYEAVGREIGGLIIAYGAYKAAVISLATVQNTAKNLHYSYELAELSKLLPIKEASKNADIEAAVASGKLSQSKAEQVIAIRATIAAKLEELKTTAANSAAEVVAANDNLVLLQRKETAIRSEIATLGTKMSAITGVQNAELTLQLTEQKRAAINIQKTAQHNLEILQAQQLIEMGSLKELKLSKASKIEIGNKQLEIAAIKEKITAMQAEVAAAGVNVNSITAEMSAQKALTSEKAAGVVQNQFNAKVQKLNNIQNEIGASKSNLLRTAEASETANKELNSFATGVNTVSKNINTKSSTALFFANFKLTAITTKLNAVIKNNPYMIAATVIAALTYGIYKLCAAESEAEVIQRKVNSAVSDFTAETMEEQKEIDSLFGALDGAKEGTKEYETAKQAIIDKYGQYLSGLVSETGELLNVAMAYDRITFAAQEAAKARGMASIKDDAIKEWKTERGELNEELREVLADEGLDERAQSAFISRLNRELASGGKLSAEMEKRIEGFERVKSVSDYYINPNEENYVKNKIGQIQHADKKKDTTIKKGKEALGIDIVDWSAFNNQGDKELKGNKAGLDAAMGKIVNGAKEVEVVFANGYKRIYKGADELWLDQNRYSQALDKRIQAEKAGTEGKKPDTNRDVINTLNKNIAENNKKIANLRKLDAVSNEDEIKELEKQNKESESSLKTLTGKGVEKPKAVDWKELRDKEAKDSKNYADSVADITKRGEMERRQTVIDGMVDSSEKELVQIELNYDKKKYEIERQEANLIETLRKRNLEKWKLENPNKKDYEYAGTTNKDDLSFELKTMLANENQSNEAERFRAVRAMLDKERMAMDEYLAEYGSFQEKKAAIAAICADKIAKATTKGEKLSLEKERDNAIKEIDFDAFSKNIDFAGALGNIDKLSIDYIKSLSDKLREYIKEVGNTLKPDDLKTLMDALNSMDKKVAEKSNFGDIGARFKDYKASLNGVEKANKDLELAQAGLLTNGFVLDKQTGDMVPKIISEEEARKKLTESEKASADAKEMLCLSADTVNAKIQGSIGIAESSLSILSDLGVEIPEELSGALEGLGATSQGVTDAIKGFTSGNIIAGIQGVVSAIGGMIKTIGSLFSGDGRKNRQIATMQDQVDNLEKSYERLEKAVEDAYSVAASNMINKQEANLRQQQKLIEQQLKLEKSKKNSDDGKIKEYEKSLEDTADKIKELEKKAIEAINGTSIQNAISDFASAYVDAWGAGDDKVKSTQDTVKKMVRAAVTELIKSRMSGEVEAFMNYLAMAMTDGILTPAEDRMLTDLNNKIIEGAGMIDKGFDKYLKDDNSARTATSNSGITASQDSVDKLSGCVTTIQSHTFNIVEQNKSLLLMNRAIMENVSIIRQQSMLLDHLSRLEGIENGIVSMKRDISSIYLQGLNIKRR